MPSYLLCFSWGIFILLSWTGWGCLLQRLLLLPYRVDWGQKATWGLVLALFVGGVLNATRTLSPTAIWIFLIMGFLSWLLDVARHKQFVTTGLLAQIKDCRKDPLLCIGLILAFLLVTFQYAGWVSSTNFSRYDEFQAYFVFPHKMLQAGCLGPDPFCDRRIASCLGGKSFLDTLVLTAFSEKNLYLVDPGVALLMVVGLLFGYLKSKGVSSRLSVFTVILFLLVPLPVVNITALMVPVALFLSLFRILDSKERPRTPFMANALIIALLVAGLCSLKSTFIPVCVILLALSYVFSLFRAPRGKTVVFEFLCSAVLVFVFLLPWMICEYQAAGTLLFPYLGKGRYEFVGGLDYFREFSPLGIFKIVLKYVSDFYVAVLVLLALVVIGLKPLRPRRRATSLAIFLTAGLSCLIVFLANGGEQARLFFPIILPAIMTLFVQALADAATPIKNKIANASIPAFAVTLVAGMLLGNGWYDIRWQLLHQNLGNIMSGLKNLPLVSQGDIDQYTQMQSAIPAGQTVFTRLNKPFLLDFRRNTIYLCDSPGNLILPRNMPFFQGAEALANYLVTKSIRYVAYSYATEAEYPKEKWAFRLNDTFVWNRTQSKHSFDLQDNLKQLGDTRKRIYDDGDIFVLDLLQGK